MFTRVINRINDRVGKGVSFLLLVLMAIAVFEVIARYVFNKPTIWAWDINIQVCCLIACFGAGYTLLHDGHVKVDILVTGLSPRRRAMVDLITSLLFFLGMGILIWQGWEQGIKAVAIRESLSTVWAPPIYPLKMTLVVAGVLLLLQGAVKFRRDLGIILSKRGQS